MNDYADQIAAQAKFPVSLLGNLTAYEAEVLRAAIAEAAREGYALGYGAAHG